MNHAIDVHLGANIDKYKAGMDAAKKMGSESLGFIASIFDKIKSMFSGMWDSFKSFFSGGADKFKSTFGSMSDSASGAFGKISGYFAGFNSDLDKSKGKMDETEKQSSSLASKIGVGLVAAFVAVTAVVGTLTAKGLALDATFAGIAISSDIAVSRISRFEAAASRSGVGIKDLGASMAKFHEEMAKAAAGDGTDPFTKMGVKVADSNNALLKTDDVLIDVSKKIAGMSTEAEKYASAVKLGFDGKVQVLEDIAHASDLSARVTDEQAAAVKRLGAIWREILPSGQSMWSTISDKLTNSLTPAMTTASVSILESKNRIVEAFSQIYGGGSFLDKLGDKIRDWSKSASTWFAGVEKSATDMTISVMKYVAAKTGLGNVDAFKPSGTGYVPAPVKLTSDKSDPVTKTADAEALKQYEAMTKAINEKIAAQKLEAQTGQALTDGQRMAVQFAVALRDGTLQLTDAQKAERAAQLATLISQEQSNKQMQDAKAAAAAASKKEEDQYASLIASIQSKVEANRIELAVGAEATESQKMLAKLNAELASGKLKLTAAHEAAARAAIQELAVTEEQIKSGKQYSEMIKAMHDSGVAAISSLDEQIAKQREHNAEIGKTKEQIELAKKAQLDAETVQMQSDANYLRDGMAKWELDEKSRAAYQMRLSDLDAEIERRKILSSEIAKGADLEAVAAATESLKDFLDPTKAEKFGTALKASLGGAAQSMVALTSALTKYRAEQEDSEKARQAAQIQRDKGDKTQEEYLAKLDLINAKSTSQQVAGYGNMASAAASFFGEHSRGYQALMTVSQVFHAAELAMNLASIAPAMAAGAAQMFAQSGWGGFAGVAAMAAVIAGFGVAVGGIGGHSDTTAKDRQAVQGTGTILGDGDAKSDSVKKSLDMIEKNTYQGLAISSGMLTTLRSIDSNIASFASQLVQSGVVSGANVETSNSGMYNALNSGAASGLGTVAGAGVGYMAGAGLSAFTSLAALGGPIGLVVGAIAGKYLGSALSSVFGGKQSVSDTGFTLDKTSLGAALAGGVNARSYADITTSGGWFRGDSHDTKTGDLGADADQQFSTIIKSLASSIIQAGQMLGLSSDDFTNKLNSFVIDIGKVSLKDLKGEELQKALESVFSKLGDQMAAYAVDGLQKLQQVGEGYLETLTRLATEYQTVDVVFQSFGKTFGAVGLSSIEARDRLVQLAGGLDKFTSQGEYFLTNFFSDQEQAAALRKRIDPMLAQYGLSSEGENAAKAFRDFVVSLDTTTEAGAQAYSTLMTIAPALKSVIDAEKSALDERKTLQDKLDELTMTSAQLREKERAAVDASNLALYDRIAALQAEKDAASTLLGNVDSTFSVLQKVVEREKKAVQTSVDAHTAAVSKLQSLSQSLRGALDGIKSPDQQVLARAAAQSQIRAVLASVKAGGQLPDVDSLKDALSAVSKDSTDRFATYQDYLKDLYQTQNDIAQLGDVTDDQLSVEQKALKAAQDQLDSLDEQLKAAQEQVDILKGIDTNGLSLLDAMRGLTSAILQAQSNPIVGATSAINGAYQSALHRAPDAAGLEWWQNAAANGAPISQIVDGIKGSTEATLNTLYRDVLGRAPDAEGLAFWMNAYGSTMDAAEQADWLKAAQKDPGYKIPGFATGGDFAGGWRIVGENGPELEATGPARIFNASQTSSLMSRLSSPSANADVLAASVDRLTAASTRQEETIARLEVALNQTQRHAKRSADTLERVTRGGDKMVTTTE